MQTNEYQLFTLTDYY